MSLPYDWYPAVVSAINRIGQGATKTMACDENFVSIATFDAYVKRDTTLQVMLIEAEQRGYDAMADALLQPDNHTQYGQSNPQMAKVMSDNIKWFLSKKKPKEYGERIEVKHEFTLDRAITDAMDRAKQRAIGETIDITPNEVTPAIEASVVDVVAHVVSEDDMLLAELLS